MKTLETTSPVIQETEKNALILRLELIQKDVRRLRLGLSSYLCEPKTYSLYERIENLKNGLDQLAKTNNEVIESIRRTRRQVNSYVESVKNQLAEFDVMHKDVEDYYQCTMVAGRCQ